MNRIREVGMLAGLVLVAAACDQAALTDPLPPEVTAPEPVALATEAGADCTCKCTPCLPPNAAACEFRCVYVGQCRDTPLAVDRNGNGVVCGATPEGPYIDDVDPPRAVLRKRPPQVTPCLNPAYPVSVEIGVGED